jgi:hypothetical protein
MPRPVLLVIDCVLSHADHASGMGWQDNFRRSFEQPDAGLPFMLDRLRRDGLKAVFFIDPMPAALFGQIALDRMAAPLVRAQQDIQLMIDPRWQGADRRFGPENLSDFLLADYERAAQARIIGEGLDYWSAAGLPMPVAFRAANDAVNADTVHAMAAHGLSLDLSQPRERPDPKTLPSTVDHVAVPDHGVFWRKSGRLQPMHQPIFATRRVLAREAAAARAHPVPLIMTSRDLLHPVTGHSDRGALRRFEALCRMLAERQARLPTCHVAGPAPIRITA